MGLNSGSCLESLGETFKQDELNQNLRGGESIVCEKAFPGDYNVQAVLGTT